MTPYTTKTRARIQPADIARALLTDPFTATLSLATLERIRTYQAEAEVASLLQQDGVQPRSISSRVAMVRQTLGTALVRAGHRVAGAPPSITSLAKILSDGTLPTAS